MRTATVMIAFLALFLGSLQESFGEYCWPEGETYRQNTVEKGSGTLRSRLTGTFEKISDDRYSLTRSGTGNYSTFDDALWTLESETELRDDLLCPVYTLLTIRNNGEQKSTTCRNDYDYTNKVIRISQKDALNRTTGEFTFPLEARTTDYATLIYFLKPFINDLIAGKTIRFNFLSSEPGLYTLKARFAGEDSLLIGSQEIETVKVAITPDRGTLNLILDRFLPPTLLWYGKKAPHLWLKYEGLESGRRSARIITTVEEIVPF